MDEFDFKADDDDIAYLNIYTLCYFPELDQQSNARTDQDHVTRLVIEQIQKDNDLKTNVSPQSEKLKIIKQTHLTERVEEHGADGKTSHRSVVLPEGNIVLESQEVEEHVEKRDNHRNPEKIGVRFEEHSLNFFRVLIFRSY